MLHLCLHFIINKAIDAINKGKIVITIDNHHICEIQSTFAIIAHIGVNIATRTARTKLSFNLGLVSDSNSRLVASKYLSFSSQETFFCSPFLFSMIVLPYNIFSVIKFLVRFSKNDLRCKSS